MTNVIDWDAGGVGDPADDDVLDLDGGALVPTMTDEDVEAVTETLSNIEKDPDMVKAKELAKEEREGEIINAAVTVDPDTGERTMVSEEKEDDDSEFITETFEEFLKNHENDELDVSLNDEAIMKTLKEQYADTGMTGADMYLVINVLHEYQEGNVSYSQAYNKFPKSLRNYFDLQAANAGIPIGMMNDARKRFMKYVLESFISEAALNKYIIDMNNELQQIYKEFGEDMSKFYKDSFNEKIDTLKRTRDSIAESDDEKKEEKVEGLNKIIDGMEQSVSLEKLKAAVPKIKIKHFELEKPVKVVSQFNQKYNNSKYSIQNLKSIFPILIKAPVGFTHEEAVLFGLCFCKYCRFFKPTNIDEHTFMYYTIANIISLSIYSNDNVEPDDFAKAFTQNIKDIVAIYKESHK